MRNISAVLYFSSAEYPLPKLRRLEIGDFEWPAKGGDFLASFLSRHGQKIKALIVAGSLPNDVARFFGPLELIHFSNADPLLHQLLIANPRKLKSLSATLSLEKLALLPLEDAALEQVELRIKLFSFPMTPMSDIYDQLLRLIKAKLSPSHGSLRFVSLSSGTQSIMGLLLNEIGRQKSRGEVSGEQILLQGLRELDAKVFPLRAFCHPLHPNAFAALLNDGSISPTPETWLPVFQLIFRDLTPAQQFDALRCALETQPNLQSPPKSTGLATIADHLISTLGWPLPAESRGCGLWVCIRLLGQTLVPDSVTSVWLERFIALLSPADDFVDVFACGKSASLPDRVWKALLWNVELSRKTGFYSDIFLNFLPPGITCAPQVMCHPDFDLQWVVQCPNPRLPLSFLLAVCSSAQAQDFPTLPKIFHAALELAAMAGMQGLISDLLVCRWGTTPRPARDTSSSIAWNVDLFGRLSPETIILVFQTFMDAGADLRYPLILVIYQNCGNSFSLFKRIRELYSTNSFSQITAAEKYYSTAITLKMFDSWLWIAVKELSKEHPSRAEALDAEVFQITGARQTSLLKTSPLPSSFPAPMGRAPTRDWRDGSDRPGQREEPADSGRWRSQQPRGN